MLTQLGQTLSDKYYPVIQALRDDTSFDESHQEDGDLAIAELGNLKKVITCSIETMKIMSSAYNRGASDVATEWENTVTDINEIIQDIQKEMNEFVDVYDHGKMVREETARWVGV